MATQVLHFAVLGHSFIRRADQHLADHNVINFGLPLFSHKIDLQGQGGAHILDIIPLLESCTSTPDVVMIDVGTNDLTNRRAPPHTLALQVFNIARRLVTHHNVKHVVLFQILPRTTWGRHGQPPAFSARVARYNEMIESLIYRYKDSLPISCWVHKGMRSNIDKFISDGVHLNEAGMTKYIKSVRRAILATSRRVR